MPLSVLLALFLGLLSGATPDPAPHKEAGGKPSTSASPTPPSPTGADALKGCPEGTAKGCKHAGFEALGAQDYPRALELYQRACDGQDANGCTMLGLLYETGTAPSGRDRDKAAALFQRACDAQDAYGCYNLGLAYESGRAVPEDPARAAQLYLTACDKGYGKACYNLSTLYDDGLGVTGDKAHAAQLRTRACEMGVKVACPR